jgi:hypothetical protein
MAAEILPEHVLARTPELIAWWSRAQPRLMFFGDGNAEAKKLNGKMFPHPALVFMIHGRELFVRALAENCRPRGDTHLKHAPLLEHRLGRPSLSGQYASSGGSKCRLLVGMGGRIFRQRIYPSKWRRSINNAFRRVLRSVVKPCWTEAFSCEVSGRQPTNSSGIHRQKR